MPLPKLSRLKTIGAAVASSVIAVLILAQIAVYPAAKKPYITANTIKTGKVWANPHMVRQETAATTVDEQAKTLSGTLRSDKEPNTNWPQT